MVTVLVIPQMARIAGVAEDDGRSANVAVVARVAADQRAEVEAVGTLSRFADDVRDRRLAHLCRLTIH